MGPFCLLVAKTHSMQTVLGWLTSPNKNNGGHHVSYLSWGMEDAVNVPVANTIDAPPAMGNSRIGPGSCQGQRGAEDLSLVITSSAGMA